MYKIDINQQIIRGVCRYDVIATDDITYVLSADLAYMRYRLMSRCL